MKDMTKKVVILNNFSSPYISEAIIVLREYDRKLEGKIIADAEKIVADYIAAHQPKSPSKLPSGTVPNTKKQRPLHTAANKAAKTKAPKMKKKPHITAAVLLIVLAAAAAGALLWIMD